MFQFGYRPIESNALNGVQTTLASIRLVRQIALLDAT